ncbi:hypothetical protein HYFRA_00002741 [Hymenoscyphus fraxineus]|uniref:Uncharacterized protein n=1 Tax=Hymenoscyphus fraxineus TaxID=746836 RepID=A0A9N9KML4_9HELO|nr:hypothetical protein HYFRA_00002741 [Hymenoscyphus fraxineus]
MSSPPTSRPSSHLSKRKGKHHNEGTKALITGSDPILEPEPSLKMKLTSWFRTPSSSPISSPTVPTTPRVEKGKERGVKGGTPSSSLDDVGYLGDLEDGEGTGKKKKQKKKGKGKEREIERGLLEGPTYIDHEGQLAEARNMVCASPVTENFPDSSGMAKDGKEKEAQGKRKRRGIWNFFSRRCGVGSQDGGLGALGDCEILVDECDDDFLLIRIKSPDKQDFDNRQENFMSTTVNPRDLKRRNIDQNTKQSTNTDHHQMGESQPAPFPIPHSSKDNKRTFKRSYPKHRTISPRPKKRSYSVHKNTAGQSRSMAKLLSPQARQEKYSFPVHRRNYFQVEQQAETAIRDEMQEAMETSLPKTPWYLPLQNEMGTGLPLISDVGLSLRPEDPHQTTNSITLTNTLHPHTSNIPQQNPELTITSASPPNTTFHTDTILNSYSPHELSATEKEEVLEIEEILRALDKPPVEWDVAGVSIPVGEKYLRALESSLIDEMPLVSDAFEEGDRYLLAPVSSPIREGFEVDGEREIWEEEGADDEDSGFVAGAFEGRGERVGDLQFDMEMEMCFAEENEEVNEFEDKYGDFGEDLSPNDVSTKPLPRFSYFNDYSNENTPPKSPSPLLYKNSKTTNHLIPRRPLSETTNNSTPSQRPTPLRIPTTNSLADSITTTHSSPPKEWWYGTTPPPSTPPPAPQTWMEMPVPTSRLSPRLHIRGGYMHSPLSPSPSPSPSTSSTPSALSTPSTPTPSTPTPTLSLRGGGGKKSPLSLFSINVPIGDVSRGKKLLNKQVGFPFYVVGGPPGVDMTWRSFVKQARKKVEREKRIEAKKEARREEEEEIEEKIRALKMELKEVRSGKGKGENGGEGAGSGNGNGNEETTENSGTGEATGTGDGETADAAAEAGTE